MLRKEFAQISEDSDDGWLLNENMVFGTAQTPALQTELLAAHWCVTVLYTDTGWVFGKFPKGLRPPNRTDIKVSSFQHDLFSIRKTIPETDKRFYTRLGQLQFEFANQDDGSIIVPELLSEIDPSTLSDQETVVRSVRASITNHVMQHIKERVEQKASSLNITPEDRYRPELAKSVRDVL